MGRFVAGDVIFLRFPFDDLSSEKSRPALVLGAVDRSRYLVAYVTSQEKQKRQGAIVDGRPWELICGNGCMEWGR